MGLNCLPVKPYKFQTEQQFAIGQNSCTSTIFFSQCALFTIINKENYHIILI